MGTGKLDTAIFNAKSIEFIFHRDGRHRAAFGASSGTAKSFKPIQIVCGTVDRDNDRRPHSQSGGTYERLPPFMMVVSIGDPQHCCRTYSSVCSERRIQLACRYESPGTLLSYRNGRFQDYGRIAVERFTWNVIRSVRRGQSNGDGDALRTSMRAVLWTRTVRMWSLPFSTLQWAWLAESSPSFYSSSSKPANVSHHV